MFAADSYTSSIMSWKEDGFAERHSCWVRRYAQTYQILDIIGRVGLGSVRGIGYTVIVLTHVAESVLTHIAELVESINDAEMAAVLWSC